MAVAVIEAARMKKDETCSASLVKPLSGKGQISTYAGEDSCADGTPSTEYGRDPNQKLNDRGDQRNYVCNEHPFADSLISFQAVL